MEKIKVAMIFLLIFSLFCFSCFIISIEATKIIDNSDINIHVFRYLLDHANWTLYARHGGAWHKTTGLHLIFTNISNSTKKLSLDFTNNEGLRSDFRLNFSVDLPITGNYSRNGWEFIAEYHNLTLIFNASDLKNIPGLIFDYGLHGNTFFFTIQRNNVPIGYHIILDPWYSVTASGSTSATKFNFQHKIFRDTKGNLFGTGIKVSITEYPIFFNSSNNGLTWSNQVFDGTFVTYNSLGSTICSNSTDTIYLVYSKQANNKKFYFNLTKTNDVGVTWTAKEKLNTYENYSFQFPSAEFDTLNRLHVVFQGYCLGSTTFLQVRYMRINADGTHTAPINLTWSTWGHQSQPNIEVDRNNNLHVVWVGANVPSGTTSIHYIMYNNATSTWSTPINISSTSVNCQEPIICLDSQNRIRVAFDSVAYSSPYNIQFTFNNGSGWSSPINLTTTTTVGRHQLRPVMSIDTNDLITILFDGRHVGSISYNQIRETHSSNCITWSTPINITSGNLQHTYANCINCIRPKTGSYYYYDIPKTGYAFIFTNASTIYYQSAPNLVWITTLTASLINFTSIYPVNNTVYNVSIVKCYYQLNFSINISNNKSLLMSLSMFINLRPIYTMFALNNGTYTINLSNYWTGYRFNYSEIQNLTFNCSDEIGTYKNETYYFSYIYDNKTTDTLFLSGIATLYLDINIILISLLISFLFLINYILSNNYTRNNGILLLIGTLGFAFLSIYMIINFFLNNTVEGIIYQLIYTVFFIIYLLFSIFLAIDLKK